MADDVNLPNDQELSRAELNRRFGTSLLRHAVGCSSQYTLEFRQLAAEILRLRGERDQLLQRERRVAELVAKMRLQGDRACPDVRQPADGWSAIDAVARPLGAALLTWADQFGEAIEETHG